jgi:hypothetical protein
MNVNKTMFVLGLLVVLIAAVILLLDVTESSVAGGVGMIGIILLATSGSDERRAQ